MGLKETYVQFQLNRCHKRYEEKRSFLGDAYGAWLLKNEDGAKRRKGGCGKTDILWIDLEQLAKVILYSDKVDMGQVPDGWFAVTLLHGEVRMPSEKWASKFSSVSEFGLIYGDEDMDNGGRFGAWMKPEYSPETFFSFFYFGSIVFLRGDIVKEVLKGRKQKLYADQRILYDFIFSYLEYLERENMKVLHIPEILFTAHTEIPFETENPLKAEVTNPEAYFGYEPDCDEIKKEHAKRMGVDVAFQHIEHAGTTYSVPVYDIKGAPKVSVIIPSKDNPEVLTTCIESFVRETDYKNYEIIVVDNGSTEANRMEIVLLQSRFGFIYVYEPMEFNFSRMCNIGVEKATGDYLLLLNDDMEIIQKDWLRVMLGQAMQKNIGAVGAKLLYPNSDLIQHVGITNLPVGPAHKLLKEHDAKADYYYGRNVLPYDMMGVTAACLLVSAEAYRKVGGLPEDVAISYNDVDLNFSLFEAGYRNVLRPDVVLYHHESLSRGDDRLSDEKWDRLLHEKEHVYERHPSCEGYDPYYSPNLAGYKSKYFCNYLYDHEIRTRFNTLKNFHGPIPEEWHNNALTISWEHLRLERRLELYQEEDAYLIEGWSYVLNMDNSRYERSLILMDEEGNYYSSDVFERYRPDVKKILPEQTNVELAGFDVRLPRALLKPGKYSVALLCKDRCSRQRLYKEWDEIFVVEA
ncbi:MAG: glycosyltransferase [Lachnospiraceae bacterium]|nr:glycosyltransferase [Lachnospiraceae bacterium]